MDGSLEHGAGSLRLHERDRDGAFRSGGNPGDGTCEISPVTKSGEAVSSDNGFDRTSFLSGDQIKVTEGEEQHFQNIENLDLNMGVASSRSAMDPVRISCSAPSEPANSSASRMERP